MFPLMMRGENNQYEKEVSRSIRCILSQNPGKIVSVGQLSMVGAAELVERETNIPIGNPLKSLTAYLVSRLSLKKSGDKRDWAHQQDMDDMLKIGSHEVCRKANTEACPIRANGSAKLAVSEERNPSPHRTALDGEMVWRETDVCGSLSKISLDETLVSSWDYDEEPSQYELSQSWCFIKCFRILDAFLQ